MNGKKSSYIVNGSSGMDTCISVNRETEWPYSIATRIITDGLQTIYER